MEVVFSLVGISVLLVLLVAVALIWSVRSGQFDDLEGPAWRMLMDEDQEPQDVERGEEATRRSEEKPVRTGPPGGKA